MKTLTLIPAYGRDYKSKAEVLKDWKAGKDFHCAGLFYSGAAASIRDLPQIKQEGFDSLSFRYKQATQQFYLEIK